MILNSADAVAALGGYQFLAKSLKLHWRTVYNWTRPERRIPEEMWHHIAAVPGAENAGVTMAILASLPLNPKQKVRTQLSDPMQKHR
jgi:hypothetical protein